MSEKRHFLPRLDANRPLSAKVSFSHEFVKAFHEDFIKHGPGVIQDVRLAKPEVYLKVAAAMVPKEFLVEVSKSLGDMSDAELARLALDAAPKIIEHITHEAEAGDDGEAEEGE
jgi:hypothetical protein